MEAEIFFGRTLRYRNTLRQRIEIFSIPVWQDIEIVCMYVSCMYVSYIYVDCMYMYTVCICLVCQFTCSWLPIQTWSNFSKFLTKVEPKSWKVTDTYCWDSRLVVVRKGTLQTPSGQHEKPRVPQGWHQQTSQWQLTPELSGGRHCFVQGEQEYMMSR